MTPNEARDFFIKEFPTVLISKKEFEEGKQLPVMKGEPMQIHLKENAKPFARHTPNSIPIPWREAVKKELDTLVQQGIIEPVPDTVASEWCASMVCAAKSDFKPRITVDFKHLNSQVIRTAHPFPSPQDVIRRIPPGVKFFTKMDAIMGFWQLPLDEEAQHLTHFVTDWGVYKFKRCPMGLITSSDVFCHRTDKALSRVDNTGKVVDDILSWDFTYADHIDRIYDILCRCLDNNVSLNKDKFDFAEAHADYCGYHVTSQGIEADPKKLEAIRNFPSPKNITDLRSFFGLVNQLGDFSSEIACSADTLRPLLSPKNTFIWTENHEQAFNRVKQALVSTPILAHFDPTKPTSIQTDTSRLNGIGYALLQNHDGKWRLIQCGSRFLTKTESSCYSTGELEMLGAVWAIHKCRLYLLGLPSFELVVDHKPLVPMFNVYTLDQIPTPRLQRLRDKLSGYAYHAVWRKGKDHAIPDALSRAPVNQPTDEDRMIDDDPPGTFLRAIVAANSTNPDDLVLEDLRSNAALDESYKKLVERVTQGFPASKASLPQDLLPFWKIKDDLTFDDGLVLYRHRIVVPKPLRRSVLTKLHSSHRGVEATKRRANDTVWWPGINNDIATTVESCSACQTHQPSTQREPIKRDHVAKRPFEHVSVDLFTYSNRNYLIYADRFTGWSEIHMYTGDMTSRTTVRAIRHFFGELGVPTHLRSDGGPQFDSHLFRSFMERWRVVHEMSTPHYPQSNGHAESHVKKLKHLITKTSPSGDLYADDEFAEGLIELRNTPGPDGLSPSVLLLGRPLRSLVPVHRSAFDLKWQEINKGLDARKSSQDKADERYNARSKPLSNIPLGTEVRVQHYDTRKWDTTGIIVGVGSKRDYLVKTPSGSILWRNRRFLRPVPAEPDAPAETTPAAVEDPPTVRRSPRLKAKQVKFTVTQ